jgi:hypothetical protein
MADIQEGAAIIPLTAHMGKVLAEVNFMIDQVRAQDICVWLAKCKAYSFQGVGVLYPPFLDGFHEVLAEIKKDHPKAVAARTFRTYAEQDAIYAQGRTKDGNIVTNARGGESYHCFGLAVDISDDVAARLAEERGLQDRVQALCIKHNITWGKDWGDWGHFEWHPGFTFRDLRVFIG